MKAAAVALTRVIDRRTGRFVKAGEAVATKTADITLNNVRIVAGKLVGNVTVEKQQRDVPLIVSLVHPMHLFQRVAYLPE